MGVKLPSIVLYTGVFVITGFVISRVNTPLSYVNQAFKFVV